ncbi:MAG: phage major capsid protein [Patescibacteria group bacterium]|nr:phage major capsid protein [Patescibacteria group bacterium]
MSFSVAIANDVTASTLENFNNPGDPKEILQRVADKPLLRDLLANKMEFDAAGPAAGTTTPANFREPVMGALMRDKPSNYSGISGADVLTFNTSDGAVQNTAPIRWMHSGMEITHEELMYQGVIVNDNKAGAPSKNDRVLLFKALELKKADYFESLQYGRNLTLWNDGSQDAKAIPGVKSIITDDPTVGTTLGIARTNIWWRHVADTGVGGAGAKLSYSKADQTLTETLNRRILVDLTRFGGRPDTFYAGSDLIDAIRREMRSKGMITVDGWNDKYTNVAVNGVRFGNANIEYDPTLDQIGESKSIYGWDSRTFKLRTQKGQWGKVTAQNQPADQFVMLTSTTDRGVLTCRQMDSCYKGVMN